MIISVSQQKGGVGKTATCVMLSHFFSFVRHYKVLIIDMDAQGNATTSFIEKDGTSLKRVVVDKIPFDAILKRTAIDNIDIISSDIEMEDLETHLIVSPDGAYLLKDLIEDKQLRQKYDIILIDTPPHLGRLTVSSLLASDFVLIPLESKIYAADGLSNLLTTIEEIQSKPRLNPHLKILGAFVNKFEERTLVSRGILESLRKQIPDVLLNTTVRYNIRIEECVAKRKLLYTYDPQSHAAEDFTRLGEEILTVAAVKGTLIPEGSLS